MVRSPTLARSKLRARLQLTRWKLGGVTDIIKTPLTFSDAAERVFAKPQTDTMEHSTFNPLCATKP